MSNSKYKLRQNTFVFLNLDVKLNGLWLVWCNACPVFDFPAVLLISAVLMMCCYVCCVAGSLNRAAVRAGLLTTNIRHF